MKKLSPGTWVIIVFVIVLTSLLITIAVKHQRSQAKVQNMNGTRVIMLIGILVALIATASYVLIGYPARRRSSQECVVCRISVNTSVAFQIFRKTVTNDSVVAQYFDREGLIHEHWFWPKANVAYNLIGRPCRTANFRRHPAFGISPEAELEYLTNSLAKDAVLSICLSLTNEANAGRFREAIELKKSAPSQ
jgi:hypothetical protein